MSNTTRQRNLLKFRQAFRIMTADRTFPPDRQQRLFQWCQAALLDWDEARRFVRKDAIAFLRRYIARNPNNIDEIYRMQRRLLLEDIDPFNPTPRKLYVALFTLLLIITVGPGSCVLFSLLLIVIGINPNISIFPAFVMSLIATALVVKLVWNHVESLQRARVQPQPQPQALPQVRPQPQPQAQPQSQQPQLQARPQLQHNTIHDPTPVLNVTELRRYVFKLSGNGFEHWVVQILTFTGWQQATCAGGAADRGVDIRGIYRGEQCIVQCKNYRNRHVTPKEVRELIGTLHIQRAQRAIFITSSFYSSQCYQETVGHPVELWNLETLANKVQETILSQPHKPIPRNLMTSYLQHPPSA